MTDNLGDMPQFDSKDLNKSGVATAAPTTVFGPFPTADDIQKHGSFWELKSATGKTLRVQFEGGRVEQCKVKVMASRTLSGDFTVGHILQTKEQGYSVLPCWRTHTVGNIDSSVTARPVDSFDTLLGEAPFYLGSVVRDKVTGVIGLVISSNLSSFSSADTLPALLDAKYFYRVSWCDENPSASSPVNEAGLDFLGCPPQQPTYGNAGAAYFDDLNAKYSTTTAK